MKNNNIITFLLMGALVLSPTLIFAHDVPVHQQITLNAVSSAQRFSLGYTSFLNAITPVGPFTGDNTMFIDEGLVLYIGQAPQKTPQEWMIEGSAREDDQLADDGGYSVRYTPQRTAHNDRVKTGIRKLDTT